MEPSSASVDEMEPGAMVVHVGIDLAWNNRARTGLAAVDASGALLTSTSARTDDDIDDWIVRLGPGIVNAAIDAPLIITNATGMRECERLIGQSYGRYDASCHASNLGKPYFNPPRAAVLAERHGWATDPHHRATTSTPGAIEVYPHAAMVGLFSIGRILKYKSGDFVTRHAAFAQLVDRLETIQVLALEDNRRWQELRQIAAAATRPFHLDGIEDEVDAILCAHLAWLWDNRPATLHVYGDAENGYIIAPPKPDHPATPRALPPSGAGGPILAPPFDGEPALISAEPDPVPPLSATTLASKAVDVRGRPTGYAGEGNEQTWKAAVRRALEGFAIPAPARVSVEIDFRLGPDQRAHNAPDLDNLVKSTIDALDGVLGRRAPKGRPEADDERIDRIVASKRFVTEHESSGAVVRIVELSWQ